MYTSKIFILFFITNEKRKKIFSKLGIVLLVTYETIPGIFNFFQLL